MVHLYKIGHSTGLHQLSVNATQGKGLNSVTVPRKLRHCYWYKRLPNRTVVETVWRLFILMVYILLCLWNIRNKAFSIHWTQLPCFM